MEGKVAIITGGASGIGEGIVRLFTKHGARVIIADIADETGKILAESLSPPATYVRCDVSKEQDVSAAVDLAMEKYAQLDIMFNNAGIVDTVNVSREVAEYEMEQFDRVMSVNVRGVMVGIKHAARVMIPRKKGCIISMASTGGVVAGMATHAYTASKHAVIGLTKNAAAELGKYGIRVNAVSPDAVATALTVRLFKPGDASAISAEEKAAVDVLGVSNRPEPNPTLCLIKIYIGSAHQNSCYDPRLKSLIPLQTRFLSKLQFIMGQIYVCCYLGEYASWFFWRAGIAEFMATFLFLYIVILTVSVSRGPTMFTPTGNSGMARVKVKAIRARSCHGITIPIDPFG